MTATRASAAWADSSSAATRARTASTIVGATVCSGKASTSETKNGLPPVSRNSSSASTPVAAAIRPTDRALRPASRSRCASALDSAPSNARKGRSMPSASSRKVITRTAGSAWIRELEVAQHVQRGTVGPVRVVDDEHRGRRGLGQLLDRGGEEPALVHGIAQRLGQRAARGAGRVAQGPERSWGEQVLAAAGEHADPARGLGEEGAHEAGLPDPGLSRHEDGGALPLGGARHGGPERLQLCLPVQQVLRHLPMVPPAPQIGIRRGTHGQSSPIRGVGPRAHGRPMDQTVITGPATYPAPPAADRAAAPGCAPRRGCALPMRRTARTCWRGPGASSWTRRSPRRQFRRPWSAPGAPARRSTPTAARCCRGCWP